MSQDIYIIEDRPELIETCREIFQHEKRELKLRPITTQEVEVALRNIPALIIIDEDNTDVNIIEFCKSIRENEDNSITPIIVVSSNTDRDHRTEVLKAEVEYYIKKPIDHDYFYFTVKNIINLLNNNRKVSPLTGLPGNVQIQAEMKKRLLNREVFAILYFDLDNFKAYNDVYGFSNGDEIIKFTARTISKHVHQIEDSDNFLGHIGGDDFVAIVSKTDYEKVCQDIILEFDKFAVSYYNEVDAERGYVEVANRRGIIEQFPLTTISIAVLEVDSKIYKNTLEIGEMASQIKHKAKTVLGSSYVINRRRF
jgi:diguanylate cyclase (GGDEF)-like protein